MAYTISNTDGTVLVILPNNSIDELTTSLTLIGKDYSDFGEYINNNFVRLLANSASSISRPPRNPLKGQIWYDTTNRKLKIYDNGFKPITGATTAATNPGNQSVGEFWWDTANEQLFVSKGTSWALVGPPFSKTIGTTGLVLPTSSFKDEVGDARNVLVLKSYGQSMALISKDSFSASLSDSSAYYNSTSTSTVVSGFTVLGDLDYLGKFTDRYISMTVDIAVIANGSNQNYSNTSQLNTQNTAIANILNGTFPISTASGATSITNPSNVNSIEMGVPVNSEARILCKVTSPSAGYQIRRFKAFSSGWVAYNIGSNNIVHTYNTPP